ncbi:MAG: fasciclin domain-containing protein [Bacteroidota bacterium]
MKKLSFSLLAMLGLFATLFIACDDDDNGDPDPVAPTISSITPNSGPVGTSVTIAGTNFGDAPTVSFGGTSATVGTSSATSITTTVPAGLSAGTVSVTVTASGETSAGSNFEVTEVTTTPGITTVTDTVVALEDLSSLEAAVLAADGDLATVLGGDGPFTLFAPNNAAFTELIEALEVEGLQGVIDVVGTDGLSEILQSHVVSGSLDAAAVIASTDSLETVGMSKIGVSVEGENVFVNGAQVVQADITVDNGVVHIIDSVINLPEIEAPGEEITITGSAEGVGDVTWTANNTYILDGLVFVNDGQTLTIEAGTVIKGNPGQGGDASALVVARGGTINAAGTAANPIIFTALSDDLMGSVADDAQGLWGGVVILGNASSNNNDSGGEKAVEGIPTEDARGTYGGTDDADNSGTFTYVSIRHGGSLLGEENELNGLTLGSVGTGTTINHVEVWANLDDGIEFFGGTVNASNLFVAYCGDDGIDTDEGYRGNVQKAIVWHTSPTLRSDDPSAMELDGGVGANESAEPFSLPNFANLTLFYDEGDNDLTNAVNIRDNSGASIYNSIAINHDAPFAVERRTDIGGTADDVVGSSFERFNEGELVISGNIFFNINGVTDPANLADAFEVQNESTADAETALETAIADNNSIVDPAFGTGATKFTPSGDAITTDLATLPEGLDALNYKGAVDPAAASPYFANWTKAWAVISQ